MTVKISTSYRRQIISYRWEAEESLLVLSSGHLLRTHFLLAFLLINGNTQLCFPENYTGLCEGIGAFSFQSLSVGITNLFNSWRFLDHSGSGLLIKTLLVPMSGFCYPKHERFLHDRSILDSEEEPWTLRRMWPEDANSAGHMSPE